MQSGPSSTEYSIDVGFEHLTPFEFARESVPKSSEHIQVVITKPVPAKSAPVAHQSKIPECKFLYLGGLKRVRLGELRKIMGPQGWGINLRHLINLSWVTDSVLEMIILQSHLKHVKTVIFKQEEVYVLSGFDPLEVGNFPWPDNISIEEKSSLLRNALITRFAKSLITTSDNRTKKFLQHFIKLHGWTTEFDVECTCQMTKSSTSPSIQSSNGRDQLPACCSDSESDNHHAESRRFSDPPFPEFPTSIPILQNQPFIFRNSLHAQSSRGESSRQSNH